MGKIIYKGVGYGGGGNSNTGDFVDVDQILSSGTKIATININNEPNDIYAPGGVSDVTVNGVSVLNSNYVAVIDLTPYATQTDLASKQDTLTPGTNITISNNVISATGGGSDVEANPQGSATDVLDKVDIDGTIYSIEGTPVEANPQGSATNTLTKLGIDNIIYDIAGGGGNTNYRELTQAQYNALTPAQQSNGTLYFITDGQGGGGGSSSSLSDLTDVNISSLANYHFLTYNLTSQKWENTNEIHSVDGYYESILLGANLTMQGNGTSQSELTQQHLKIKNSNSVNTVKYNDLELSGTGNTWDGVNTSLKNALTTLHNKITYGLAAPTRSAIDGDMHIVLDASNKKLAEYMYLTNAWILIDGTLNRFTTVWSRTARNNEAGSAYRATSPCTVLVINLNINGEASNKNLNSLINTTFAPNATIIDDNSYSTVWDNPHRNQCTLVSAMNLDTNDDIIIDNMIDSGSYTNQLHLVLQLNSFTPTEVTRKTFDATADNTWGAPVTYALPSAGTYLAIGFQSRGTGGGTQSATISCSDAATADIEQIYRQDDNVSVSVALVDYPNTITFNWGNQNDYASKGYAVYQLTSS